MYEGNDYHVQGNEKGRSHVLGSTIKIVICSVQVSRLRIHGPASTMCQASRLLGDAGEPAHELM